ADLCPEFHLEGGIGWPPHPRNPILPSGRQPRSRSLSSCFPTGPATAAASCSRPTSGECTRRSISGHVHLTRVIKFHSMTMELARQGSNCLRHLGVHSAGALSATFLISID